MRKLTKVRVKKTLLSLAMDALDVVAKLEAAKPELTMNELFFAEEVLTELYHRDFEEVGELLHSFNIIED